MRTRLLRVNKTSREINGTTNTSYLLTLTCAYTYRELGIEFIHQCAPNGIKLKTESIRLVAGLLSHQVIVLPITTTYYSVAAIKTHNSQYCFGLVS